MCGVTRINATTGLEETPHGVFALPVVHQRSLEDFRLGGPVRAFHKVPIDEVPSLDFYAKLETSDELYVTLQGAVTPGKLRYPNFPRLTSMRRRVDAFAAIADPTLQLSENPAFGLAWYSGNESWDPLDKIADVIRKVQDHVGASRVMFLGGSGGGFAALRLSARFPGSIAFVTDPQTSVADYNLVHQNRLVDCCWPGWEREAVLDRFPHRFDVRRLYQEIEPENYVYYRQSTSDQHIDIHARPFQAAVDGTCSDRSGRYRFIYEAGEIDGHGKITAGEFDRHFEAAVAFWRERR